MAISWLRSPYESFIVTLNSHPLPWLLAEGLPPPRLQGGSVCQKPFLGARARAASDHFLLLPKNSLQTAC